MLGRAEGVGWAVNVDHLRLGSRRHLGSNVDHDLAGRLLLLVELINISLDNKVGVFPIYQ